MLPAGKKNTVRTSAPAAAEKTSKSISQIPTVPHNQSQPQPTIQIQNQPEVDYETSATVIFICSTGEKRVVTFRASRKCCDVQELLNLVGIPYTHNTKIECITTSANNIDYCISVDVPVLESTSEIAAENSLQMNTAQATISQIDQQSAVAQPHSTQQLTTPDDKTVATITLTKEDAPPKDVTGFSKKRCRKVFFKEPKSIRLSKPSTIRKGKPNARVKQIETEAVIIISSSDDDENDINKSNPPSLKKQSDAKQANFTHQLPPPDDKNFPSTDVLAKKLSSPYTPGLLALCNTCGYCGYDYFKCERCTRVFVEKPELIPFPNNTEDNSDYLITFESTVPQLTNQFTTAVETSFELKKPQIYQQSVLQQPRSNQQVTSPGNNPHTSIKLAETVQPKYISGFLAVCHICGYCGFDHAQCARCRRVFSEEPKRISISKSTAAEDNTLEKENKKVLHIIQKGDISISHCSSKVPATAARCQPHTRDKQAKIEPFIIILSSDDEGDDVKSKPGCGRLKHLKKPGNKTDASTKLAKNVQSKHVTGFFAACNMCGYCGYDHFKCESCGQVFNGQPKRIPYLKSTTAKFSTNEEEKKRQMDIIQRTTGKTFNTVMFRPS